MSVVHVKSTSEFKQHISQDKLVVVDFYATWCGFISPKIEEFAKKYENVVFLKVDVDELASVAAECEISAMPTFQFYRGDKKIDEVVGADPSRVESTIKKYL